MSSYSEHDLERDLREARAARARAGGGYRAGTDRHTDSGFGRNAADRPASDRVMGFIRSRTTDHWVMFAIGLVIGAFLF
jgi:hypothetical protein